MSAWTLYPWFSGCASCRATEAMDTQCPLCVGHACLWQPREQLHARLRWDTLVSTADGGRHTGSMNAIARTGTRCTAAAPPWSPLCGMRRIARR